MSREPETITLETWQAAFSELYQRLTPYYRRSETRERIRRYVLGLLSQTERKNSWQLAETMYESGPQGMQRLLNSADWDVEAVRDELRAYVIAHLGRADGILIVDETGFLKKGHQSAGVARQYSGTAGRIENQQIGVFLAYASSQGSAFIDRELYLPEEWTGDRPRCQAAGIPAAIPFEAKTLLAQHMLARACAAQVPAQWVVADTLYSSDELRLWLEAHGYWYVLAVPCTDRVWRQGTAVSVTTVMAELPTDAWARLSAGEGSKGARYYDWAWVQLPYRSASGLAHWLVARRSLSFPHEFAYYHVYAPTTSSLTDFVRIAGARWQIEMDFEQAKGEVGLDHYQVRQWTAWYRHITLALIAHAFLAVLRSTVLAPVPDQITLTIPELRRLVPTLACSESERQHRLHWSRWRRQHQAKAKRCHTRRRQVQCPPEPVYIHPAIRLPGLGALTEAAWEGLALLLCPSARPGRPSTAHRQLLEAILWVMHAGVSWRAVPASFGPWNSIYTRYLRWVRLGLWPQIVVGLDSSAHAPS
jgi:SRSO17 transposase